ncbi:MAG: YjbQ family protein [Clostridiaceae bacterium]|nr:YjbQ family protein [Clostridiaceae bacterium]
MTEKFTLRTSSKNCLIDITSQVSSAVTASGIESGIAYIFVPHTTAGVTINENADPDVVHDILLGLDHAYPEQRGFCHYEGNSTAHLKASAMGATCTVLIEDGKLMLGTWQDIYFCEFDGPRQRSILVKVIEG